jgi:hypothetical protein
MQQRVASLSDVVHKRKEPEGQGEFLLRNAPMRAQPTPQERPEPFHRIDMHVTKAVAIFISGVFAPSMVDTLMIISPCTQAGIHAVFIRINKRTWRYGFFDAWLDGPLLHIGHHIDDHLTTPLHHPTDRWSLFGSRATATLSFEAVSTALSPLVLYHFRLAFLAGNHRRFVALHLL